MCIKEAQLDLNSNIVVFEGNNGQGKSAIMEAIAICLAEHKRSDSVKEFVQKGNDHGKIILDMNIDNEPLHFDVTLNYRGGTPLERDVVYKNKHYINSEVTDLIKTLDLSFYSDIILSMQGQDDITAITPVQRANLLQKLFQFDFSDQVKRIDDKLDEFQNNIRINKSKVDFILNDSLLKSNKLKELNKKDLPFNNDDFLKKQKEEQEIVNEIDELDKSLQEMSNYQNKKNSLLIDDRKYNVELTDLNNKKVAAKNAKKELENFDFDNKEKELKNRLNEAIIKLNEILEKQKNDDLQYDALVKDLRKITSQKATLQYKKKDIEKRLDLIKKGICPECGQSTHDLDEAGTLKIKDENDEEINDVTTKISSIEEEIKNINAELLLDRDAISRASSNKSLIDASIKSLTDNKDQLESKMMSLENWQKLEDNIKKSKENIDNNIKDISKLDEMINSLSKNFDKKNILNEQKKLLSDDIKKYNDVLLFNSTIDAQKNGYENDIKTNDLEISKLNALITSQTKDIDCYNEAKSVLDKELPNYLVVKTCAKLEQEMNDFVHIVFPQFRIRLLRSRRGVEFFYTVDDKVDFNDVKKLINAKMASGYERAVLGVAFKVALCKAYGLTFAAFDEIDAAASDENSMKTFESLIQSGTFEQMFFITHKEPTKEIIKSMADNIITYHVTEGKFINNDIED